MNRNSEMFRVVRGEKKYLVGAVLAALILLATPAGVWADNLSIQLSGTGVITVTCVDQALCDTNPLLGAVTLTTANGALTVSVGGTGSGAPALSAFNMDISYNITNSAAAPAGTYQVNVSENNLNSGGLPVSISASDNGNQPAGYTTALQAWADPANVLFTATGPTNICGPVQSMAAVVNLACGPNTFIDSGVPFFALTERITVTTLAGSGVASGDAPLNGAAVPEPASLLLLGTGLVGVGAIARRKRK